MENKKIFDQLLMLAKKGITFDIAKDSLLVKGNLQTLDEDEKVFLKSNKLQIIKLIKNQREHVNPSIVSRDKNGITPLAYSQQSLWLFDQILGGSSQYNMYGTLSLTGTLCYETLNKAFGTIVERHESLRTYFITNEEGQPQQVIQAAKPFVVNFQDFSLLSSDLQQSACTRYINEECTRDFDLSCDLMLRVHLIKIAQDDHILLVTMHHIASDGWSMGILVNEFSQLYKAHIQGQVNPLPPLPIQYADYAHWQRSWLQGEVLEQYLGYWEAQLAGLPLVHNLPLDHPRPAAQSYNGKTYVSRVDEETSDAMSRLCHAQNATLFMGLHAAFSVLLSRYSNETDIVVGTPIANRQQAEVAGLIGFFVNTLVLRSDLSGNPDFVQLLKQSKAMLLDAYAHQQVPFELLVERLQPERSLSHSPLFQVMLVLQNNEEGSLELPGLRLGQIGKIEGVAKFDLTLNIAETKNGLQLDWEYNKDIFAATTIERMASHFNTLLSSLVRNPTEGIISATLLSAIERDQLLGEWNNTSLPYPQQKCIHELFEAQVEKTPAAIALIADGQEVTYQELNAQANRLARYLLKEREIKPDTLVGLCIERSLDMVLGMLGILKAGGAYVPLDPDYPSVRLAYMLDDAQLTTVLTHSHLCTDIPISDTQAVCLDDADLQCKLSDYSTENVDLHRFSLTSSHLAYVIYTSGSTGKPKGVMVEHRNVVNFLLSMQATPGINADDCLLAVTSTSFDIHGLEIFLPLIAGAKIILAIKEWILDPHQLVRILNLYSVNMMQATPATWKMLVSIEWQPSGPFKILCGGEALIPSLANSLLSNSNIQLWNMYGPTETTIWSCVGHVRAEDERIIIGKPIANTTLYVMEQGVSPSPIGVPGELLIGGDGVTRGYWNRAALTEEKFIDNPFYDALAPNSSKRLYRTGDLVRRLADGGLEFLGRIDHQIKIRGHRVELGEIERVLSTHESVKDCAVSVKKLPSGEEGLVGYVVHKSQEIGVDNAAEKSPTFSLFYFGAETSSEENKYAFYIKSAQFADQNGFEAVWTPERHFNPVGALYPNPSVLSAALASTTSHVQLRAGSVVLPLHNPIRVAEDWSVVDNLSGGRVGLALASGWHTQDFIISPDNFLSRKQVMLDGIKTLTSLWKGESVTRKNGSNQDVEVVIFPKPIRSELPIWITTAGNPETFIEAGRLGANVLTHLIGQTIEELAEKIKLYRASLSENGHDANKFQVTLMIHAYLGENQEVVINEARAPFINYMRAHLSLLLPLLESLKISTEGITESQLEHLAGVAFERYANTAALIGTPENAIKTVQRITRSGVDEVACLIDWMDSDLALKSLDSLQSLHVATRKIIKKTASEADDFQQYLGRFLPDYMVPSAFVAMDALPLTANNKINRKELPNPTQLKKLKTYSAPINALQENLCEIWGKLLGLERVGIQEQFFEIGGTSILSIRLLTEINSKLNLNLNVADIFSYPTIEKLSAFISNTSTYPKEVKKLPVIDSKPQDIAIIGMSCRFPDADTVDAYWNNIISGHESIQDFTDEDIRSSNFNRQRHESENLIKTGVLLNGIKNFDADFFEMTPREAELLDPQQRLLMECVQHALDDAGYGNSDNDNRTGVYVTVSDSRYLVERLIENPSMLSTYGDLSLRLASSKDWVATRVAYKLNLKGPAVNINTACSSGLTAIHAACQSIRNGESKMAVAGGASILLFEPEAGVYEEGGILSADGRCRAFDCDAAGTRTGSGVGVVLLKSLSDAISDRDHIYAVIKGSAVNNDGNQKISFTSPSMFGQAAVVEAAIANAGIEPERISYIETHGTGTRIGDPVEIAGLNLAFKNVKKKNSCALGSVKPNIGHLDITAGIAGLMKVALMLNHKMLPPMVHFSKPNPLIDFEQGPFYINKERRVWEKQTLPLIAGVSSFGFGGTNAHAILEEAPEINTVKSMASEGELILLSARSASLLELEKKQLLEALNNHADMQFADIAYTLQVGRKHYSHRCAIVAKDINELKMKIHQAPFSFSGKKESKGTVIFLFPGQGSQYIGMGKSLYQANVNFKRHLDQCAQIISSFSQFNLIEYLSEQDASRDFSIVNDTYIAQPIIFSIEYALARTLMEFGVVPTLTMGHSLGQYVSACLAEVFSLQDALLIVMERGRIMQEMDAGRMLSIAHNINDVLKDIKVSNCSLAAVNSPQQCVAAGTEEQISSLKQVLDERGISSLLLNASHAFHSHLMEPALDSFRKVLQRVSFNAPSLPFLTNRDGEFASEDVANAEFWVRHIREAVAFDAGFDALENIEDCIFIEVGAGSALGKFAIQCGASKDNTLRSFASKEKSNETAEFIELLGALWSRGESIDWSQYNLNRDVGRVSLPGVVFDKTPHWIESVSVPAPMKIQNKPSEVERVKDWLYEPVWNAKSFSSRNENFKPDYSKLFSEQECCLIFSDQGGVCNQLIASLRAAGVTVYVVSVYPESYVGDFTFSVEDADGYIEVLEYIKSKGKHPKYIIHSLNITGQFDQIEFNPSLLEPNLFSVLSLTQAIEKTSTEHTITLVLLSNFANFFMQGDIVHPAKGTLPAIADTISKECLNINAMSIDIGQNVSLTKAMQAKLEYEIFSKNYRTARLLHAGVTFHRGYKKIIQSTDAQKNTFFSNQSIYLITGGFGGIGRAVAEKIATEVSAHIIFLARTEMPPEDNWNKWLDEFGHEDSTSQKIIYLQSLKKLGTQVTVFCVDVGDRNKVRYALERIENEIGSIYAVIHAAGVPGGGIMAIKERGNIEKVIGPKIYGTNILIEEIKNSITPPHFFIQCSSVSSIKASAGQYEYCAANAYQDAIGWAHNGDQSTRFITINWDAWAEQGMAFNAFNSYAHNGDYRSRMSKAIKTSEGIDIFCKAVNSDYPQVIVSLTPLSDYVDEIFNDEILDSSSSSILSAQMENADSADEEGIQQRLKEIYQRLIGIDQVSVNDDFFELGGDSLLLIKLLGEINQLWGIRMPIKEAYENPTVEKLTFFISHINSLKVGVIDDERIIVEEGII